MYSVHIQHGQERTMTQTPTLSTSDFNWHAATQTYSTEASQLGGFPPPAFTLRSARGVEVTVGMTDEEFDSEGDLVLRTYEGYAPGRMFTVVVFND
jgi:hypothetical protein